MYVCIRTADEGPGIPEEERSRIFSRFYRGAGNQQEEGVGIGLYLAREIVRKNDGYIKVGPAQRRDRFLKFIWGREFDYCGILSQLLGFRQNIVRIAL